MPLWTPLTVKAFGDIISSSHWNALHGPSGNLEYLKGQIGAVVDPATRQLREDSVHADAIQEEAVRAAALDSVNAPGEGRHLMTDGSRMAWVRPDEDFWHWIDRGWS